MLRSPVFRHPSFSDRAIGRDSCHYRGEEAPDMLMVTDFGCDLHRPRRLKYFGPEAQVMREVIANLPAEGDDHTYICEHGHSHRIMVEAPMPEGSIAGVYEINRR